MTQDEKKSTRKSSLDTLIEELDEMFINAGLGGKSVQLEPDPTRHRNSSQNDSEDAKAEASRKIELSTEETKSRSD